MGKGARAIERAVAERNRAPFDLAGMSLNGLAQLIEGNEAFHAYRPEGVYAVDPRDGGATLFNEGRSRRPKDYADRGGRTPPRPGEGPSPEDGPAPGQAPAPEEPRSSACPICGGNTTPILDIASLSAGFTFINTNLYPIITPSGGAGRSGAGAGGGNGGSGGSGGSGAGGSGRARGAHLLQWTSSD
ncbi:MAG: hypothetical protein ACOC45_08565, partial [Alkalispirochaetaceae bacterium]